jgi:hypothetical protein
MIKPSDLIAIWGYVMGNKTRKSKSYLFAPLSAFIVLLIASTIFKIFGLKLFIDNINVEMWTYLLCLTSFFIAIPFFIIAVKVDNNEKYKINNELKNHIKNGKETIQLGFVPGQGEFGSKRQFEMLIWPIVLNAQDKNRRLSISDYGLFLAGKDMSHLSDYYKKEDIEQVSNSFWKHM